MTALVANACGRRSKLVFARCMLVCCVAGLLDCTVDHGLSARRHRYCTTTTHYVYPGMSTSASSCASASTTSTTVSNHAHITTAHISTTVMLPPHHHFHQFTFLRISPVINDPSVLTAIHLGNLVMVILAMRAETRLPQARREDLVNIQITRGPAS